MTLNLKTQLTDTEMNNMMKAHTIEKKDAEGSESLSKSCDDCIKECGKGRFDCIYWNDYDDKTN